MKRKSVFKKLGILVLSFSMAAAPAAFAGSGQPVFADETQTAESGADTPDGAQAAESGADTPDVTQTAESGGADTPDGAQAAESGGADTPDVTQTADGGEQAGELKITMKTYERTYKTKSGLVYKTVSYQYPVVSGDSEAAAAINKFYAAQKKKWIKGSKNNLAYAKSDITQLAKDSGDEWDDDRHYSDDVICEITSQDDRYISVMQTGYEYTLGAHGMPYRISYILDAKTGQKVTAAQLLGMTKKEVNEKVYSLYLQKKKKLEGSDENPFFPTDSDKAFLKSMESMDFNKNMYYLKNGKLRFYVDPYALGPYAAGYIEVAVKL